MTEATAGQTGEVVASIAALRGTVVRAMPTGSRAAGDESAAAVAAASEAMREAENILAAFVADGESPAMLFPHYRQAMHKLGEARERLRAVEGNPALDRAADALGDMILRLDPTASAHKSPGVAGGVVYGPPVGKIIRPLPASE